MARLVVRMQQLPHATIRTYVDDTATCITGHRAEKQAREELGQAVATLDEWSKHAGVQLNHKTNIWASSRAQTKRVHREHRRFTPSNCVRDLGVDLTLTDDVAGTRQAQTRRLKDAQWQIQRLSWRSWSQNELSLAVRAVVLPKALWGAALHLPQPTQMGQLRCGIVRQLTTAQKGRQWTQRFLDTDHNGRPPRTPHRFSHGVHHLLGADPQRQRRRSRGSMQGLGTRAKDALDGTAPQTRPPQPLSCRTWDGRAKAHSTDRRTRARASSPGKLKHLLRDAAHHYAITQARSRSDYADAEVTDRALHRRALLLLPPTERNKLHFHQAGGGAAPEAISRRMLHQQPQCPLCGGPEASYEHCLWECVKQPLTTIMGRLTSGSGRCRGLVPQDMGAT
eukprot:2917768-Amphidinium_carterae.1